MSKELAYRFMVRNLSEQYRQTAFGFLWAVFPPVVTTIVFVVLNRSDAIHLESGGVAYPLFVLVGTCFWQLFADALSAPLRSVESAKMLLVQIDFPREALVLAGMGTVLVSFCIKALLIVGVVAWYGLTPSPQVLWALPAAAALLLLGTLIGVLLVPFGMLYRDIQFALPLLTSAWMLFTPVVYEAPTEGLLARITAWNPVSPLLLTARRAVVEQAPPSGAFWIVFAGTLLLLGFGWLVFRLALPRLAERVAS